MSVGSEPVGGDLGPPSSLDWDFEHFLGGCPPQQGAEGGRDSQWHLWPKPPLDNHCKWIEWCGQYVDMPAWWRELQVIPDIEDHWELTQKVRVSFEVPMVRYQARGRKNDYSAPPALKCIGKDWFLPPLDPRMGSQDYHLGQSRKTLAYTKAFQYWAERAKPLLPSESHQLAGSILELRQAMQPLMTFQDYGVIGEDTILCGPKVCCTIQDHPRGPFSVAHSGRWLGPGIGQVSQTFMPATPFGETLQCAVPTDQPSTSLPGLEESAGEPPWATTLPTPLMEVVKAVEIVEAAEDVEVEKVAEARVTEKDMAPGTPVWTQIHPSRAAVPVGHVPYSLGDEQHFHCSFRGAHLQAEQVQQCGNTSGSAPGSPMTTHNSSPLATSSPRVETSTEDTMVRPWAPHQGLWTLPASYREANCPKPHQDW